MTDRLPPVPVAEELRETRDRLLGPAPTLEDLPRLRAEDAAEVPDLDVLRRDGRIAVEEHTVPGPAGEVALLVCTPVDAPRGRPLLFHTHGGGYFSGDHRTGLDWFLDQAEHLGATLVSVGYRLAPEHPWPAQIDDVRAGLLAVAERADALGVDPARLVLLGTSAGGGLTAALALRLREAGDPRPAGVMLLSPMLDDRNDADSVRQMLGVDIWDGPWNGFGWQALLGDAAGGLAVAADAAPARAADLTELPPVFLEAGSAESLRDETVDWAQRIWAAGGDAELHVWQGGYHVFDWAAPEARISRAARAARRSWLERVLTDRR